MPDAGAADPVDHRIKAVEHQVAQVHDVGPLEVHDHVARGMRRAEILRGDDLVAELAPPDLGKGLVGKDLPVDRPGALGGRELESRHVGVGNDGLGRRLEDAVAAGVVAVVVGVDHGIKPAPVASRQAGEAKGRGVRELRIDDEERLGAREPADGAATAGEDAGVSPQRQEVDDRTGSRGRGWGLAGQGMPHQEAGRNEQGRTE